MSVLLLNASFEPLNVVSEKEAVCYMVGGKAVPATSEIKARFRTVKDVFEVPSILRLKYYVNVPHRKVSWSRHNVIAKRDDYTCIYCGRRPGDLQDGQRLGKGGFTLEHIIPRSRGGKDTWGNTACACYKCNHRKGNRTPNEAGMKLLWEPKRPRTNYLVASGEIPEEWKIYIG